MAKNTVKKVSLLSFLLFLSKVDREEKQSLVFDIQSAMFFENTPKLRGDGIHSLGLSDLVAIISKQRASGPTVITQTSPLVGIANGVSGV